MSDPIEAYFHQYPTFPFLPSEDDWRQIGPFNALAQHLNWSQEHRQSEWEVFKSLWFNIVEGEFRTSDLQHYQKLCEDLNIQPIPDSINTCKAELSKVYVNIVDLVQYRKDKRRGKPAQPPALFGSLEELKEYSKENGKWYPRESAKAEMLRVLLKTLSKT